MANYLIIGGDGKEYGPAAEADLRQWIAEKRLNAESRVKSESDAEFRPLAQIPEFADAFAPHATAPAAPAASSSPSPLAAAPSAPAKTSRLAIASLVLVTSGFSISSKNIL